MTFNQKLSLLAGVKYPKINVTMILSASCPFPIFQATKLHHGTVIPKPLALYAIKVGYFAV